MNAEPSTIKVQIRHQIRSLRQQLTSEHLSVADEQLCKQYQQYFPNSKNLKVAIYLQQDGEIGTTHLIRYLFQTDCTLYLPKIEGDDKNDMCFLPYDQSTSLKENRFGIPEPIDGQAINIDELDIIFLPLTAFDLKGNRLGMGGGFYDRALAELTNNRTLLIGLAYDFQQIDSCPIEEFDQPIQKIITATRMIDFNA